MGRKLKCEPDISRKPLRESRCLLRLAGSAAKVFDTINLMQQEGPRVPEGLRDVVYEAEPAYPFPLGMTEAEWTIRFWKAERLSY